MNAHDTGRGGLADAPFSFRTGKDGSVFISWRGTRAAVLAGKQAASFLARVADLDVDGQQRAMAKVTGNFKRGNERSR